MNSEHELAKSLDESIAQVRGGASVDGALEQYPSDVADQLRPLLRIATALDSEPGPSASTDELTQAILRVSEQQSVQQAARGRRASRLRRHGVLKVAAGLLVTLALGWGAVTTSADSVPGDWLYPIKLFTERAKFFLTVNPERKAELRIVFSAERLKEAVRKHQRGEGLDRQLLSEMLEEARLAIDASADFPPPQRDLIVTRAAKLSEFQKDSLARLKDQVAPEEQQIVTQYMDMCGRRSAWMRQVLEPPSAGSGQPTGDKTRARRRRLKQWRDSCPMGCD